WTPDNKSFTGFQTAERAGVSYISRQPRGHPAPRFLVLLDHSTLLKRFCNSKSRRSSSEERKCVYGKVRYLAGEKLIPVVLVKTPAQGAYLYADLDNDGSFGSSEEFRFEPAADGHR